MGYGYNQTLGSFPLDMTELLEEMLEAFGVEIGMITGAAAISGIILIIVGLLLLAMLVIAVITAILQCVAVYSIAKRRGIGHAWLAWIPIGHAWILGSIADQYQRLANGRFTRRRKVLLGIEIAGMIIALVSGLFSGFQTVATGLQLDANMLAVILLAVSVVMLCLELATFVLSIVQAVFTYISLFELFKSCSPNRAVLFLLLSIFITFAQPILMFVCRKKDDGIPADAQEQLLKEQLDAAFQSPEA